MSELVNPNKIEQIVGVSRHARAHYGRAVSEEQQFYILHSKMCLETNDDLRDCAFSLALDNGINEYDWSDLEDTPQLIQVVDDRVVPARVG